jgi:hypothetical protein
VLLAVALDHPLARHRKIPVAKLLEEPFVVTRRGQWQRALLDQSATSPPLLDD